MRIVTATLLGLASAGLFSFAGIQLIAGGEKFVPEAHAQTRSAPHQSGNPFQSPFLPPQKEEAAKTRDQANWSSAQATPAMQGAEMCEKAISKAEAKYGLPPYLLQAIAVTESGRKDGPWPWAMNIMGKAHYAQTQAELEAIVNRYGSSASIDIGCAQVNLKYHGGRFDDWRSLVDPVNNADYAAFHLMELRRELGSWGKAVAAYHSRTNWRGAGYACKVSSNYGRLLGDKRKGCGPDIDVLTAYLQKRQAS